MTIMLYKYRGIQNFRFFVDIIMKSRLFAATYKDLNDPMEGKYYYHHGVLDKTVVNKLASEKEDLRICSLSRRKDNELMWAHYAEGHRGVVVGLSIADKDFNIRPIDYNGIVFLASGQVHQATPMDILSHKLDVWSYEEEERVFIKKRKYVYIEIKEIITGRSMSNQDFSFISDLVHKIIPSVTIIKAETFI